MFVSFKKYMSVCIHKVQTDDLVDTLNEDESERQSLLTKPICFIVIGRPVALQEFKFTRGIITTNKEYFRFDRPENVVVVVVSNNYNNPFAGCWQNYPGQKGGRFLEVYLNRW